MKKKRFDRAKSFHWSNWLKRAKASFSAEEAILIKSFFNLANFGVKVDNGGAEKQKNLETLPLASNDSYKFLIVISAILWL